MLTFKRVGVVFGVVTFCIQGLGSQSRGQAIAFIPIPAPAFTGSTMTVTPVVSPDRRYVRLSVNASFNVVNGFQNFTSQLGAVGGGNFGGVGGGNVGGVGGGNVGGVGGDSFNAGMNGVIGQTGFDYGGGNGPAGFVGQAGEMRAGPLPLGGGFGADNSLPMAEGIDAGTAMRWDGWQGGEFAVAQNGPLAEAQPAETRLGRSVRATSKTVVSQHRSPLKSSSHRQNSTSSRRRGH
jgi:hypothetical protein